LGAVGPGPEGQPPDDVQFPYAIPAPYEKEIYAFRPLTP